MLRTVSLAATLLGLLTTLPGTALAVLDCELDGQPINISNGNATAERQRCPHWNDDS